MTHPTAGFHQNREPLEDTATMPLYFIGHGSPMNALEDNEFTENWAKAWALPVKPKAILCISAHWTTNNTLVGTAPFPETIYDFYGFPDSLAQLRYAAPGAPEFARFTAGLIRKTNVGFDAVRGIDHGCWSVLCRMFPLADVPVYQMSLDITKPPRWHYDLAAELKRLRNKGVLIIGSGNIVHNLKLMRFENPPFQWATAFDEKIKSFIVDGNHEAIINYPLLGAMADLSVPGHEHFLPLLYVLALKEKNEPVHFFNEKIVMGSISMRSLRIGNPLFHE